MEIIITSGAESIGRIVADAVCDALELRPNPVLGLATGSSPLSAYRELIRRHQEQDLSFQHVSAFLLDEYLGLPAGHEQLYRSFIQEQFTGRVDFDPNRLFSLDSEARDEDVECSRYEQEIVQAGGIDLAILGIGSDGHIAFNEPQSPMDSRTRRENLTLATRKDNARFFGGDPDSVPVQVLTMGIGTILEARRLILIATGAAKAGILARALEGPITTALPASALQLHPQVTIVADGCAAALLKGMDHSHPSGNAKEF